MEVVKEIPQLTYSAALVNDVMWVGGENKITLFDSTVCFLCFKMMLLCFLIFYLFCFCYVLLRFITVIFVYYVCSLYVFLLCLFVYQVCLSCLCIIILSLACIYFSSTTSEKSLFQIVWCCLCVVIGTMKMFGPETQIKRFGIYLFIICL
jgi:hypothetical protein